MSSFSVHSTSTWGNYPSDVYIGTHGLQSCLNNGVCTKTYEQQGYKGQQDDIEVYVLDRVVDDRSIKKRLEYIGGGFFYKVGHLYDGGNSIQEFATYDLSIASRSIWTSPVALKTISASSQATGTNGGTFNFLSQSLTISSESRTYSGYDYDFSIQGMMTTIEIADRGTVNILDAEDFHANYSSDDGANGAQNVYITAKNDLTYDNERNDNHLEKNAGYTVVAVDNRTGSFSLHSEKFEIQADNNALSAYGVDGAGETSSSMTAGLFGQGGVFDIRAQKGSISVKSTEAAFSDEGVERAANNTSESYGIMALTKYDPIIERDDNGDAVVSNREIIDMGESIGSKINFSARVDGSTYTINSTAYKDSAFGVYTLGSKNEVAFDGNVTINSTSLASLDVTNSESDLNAYGIVQVSTSTEVGAKVYGNFEAIYEYNPVTVYDSGSSVTLAKGASLHLNVNSLNGSAYGLMQVGENSSEFLGDLTIDINQVSENSTFKDSYAILTSGDARDYSFLSFQDERTVNVLGNLSINVNQVQKGQSLRKARAVEAKGNSIVNVNADEGSSTVAVLGDLHTSKAILEINGDYELPLPSAEYLAVNVNILSWNVIHQNTGPLGRIASSVIGLQDSPSKQTDADEPLTQVPVYLEEGRINFVMDNANSYLIGAANGNIDMEVGTGSRWFVTDDSIFENLRPTGGMIDLYHPDNYFNVDNPYQYLMVKNVTESSYTLNQTTNVGENSVFVLNTDILGNLETSGKKVLSFDGITYYEKLEGDGKIKDGTVDEKGVFTADGGYVFNGKEVAIELTGFTVAEAAARMRHDIRFGDFLDFRSYADADISDQHYQVRINDATIADGSIDYTGRVLKFATTPANVKITGDWTSIDSTAFKYKPIIWKTEHTDKYVDADGNVLTLSESVLNDQGQIQEAVNSTLFDREDYDKVVEGLTSTESQPDALDITSGMTDYWVSGYDKDMNDPGKTVTAILGINFNPIYLSTLRKRLGEVRYGAQDGLWAKAMTMQDSVDAIASSGYEQELYGLSFGYDHLVRNTEEGLWILGANLRQAHAKQELFDGAGNGETDAIGLNLYATWANYQGAYADFVLSADHYRQELSAKGETGRVTGKYNTFGWGASIEVGHMFHSTRNDLSWGPWYGSWWIEPQLQLSFYRVEGEHYTLSSGGEIRQKDADSLIGRAGIVVGKKFNYGEDREEIDRRYGQLYLKAGFKHDFLGDRTVWFNADRFEGDAAGTTTFYYGFGGDWQINERLRLHGQLERETGDGYDKDYEISLGLKYEL